MRTLYKHTTFIFYIMSTEPTIYFNGKAVKPAFAFCFENLQEEIDHDIKTIFTRIDEFSQLPPLIELFSANNLDELSDECIYNLYSFKAGVQFLMHHLEDLIDRGLLMYMFSCPFLNEELLMSLILSPLVLENCEDSFLNHLAKNPNIYEL
jgi:hypothetical protein